MKIRTDFVTNSSSSSFVVATINATDEDLLNAMATLEDVRVSAGVISIKSQEDDYGFMDEGGSVNGVIDCLLEMICDYGDNEQYEALSKKKDELAASIEKFKITSGEEGDSGELESTCHKYVEEIAEYEGRDFDDVWDEFIDCGGWVRHHVCHTFEKGKPVNTTTGYEGPIN